MIEVQNLTKRYGNHCAVQDISFRVEEGEILGFLGPNGAGKSTTMNILTGYLSASEGKVAINGFDILEQANEAKASIGYLPEQPPLYLDMTVRDYLDFMYELKKCKLPRREHIAEICRIVKIEDVYGRVIKNLSKGYRQRVGIAQALIGNPPVLILDEPTSGLDPRTRFEFKEILKDLQESGRTIFISSHVLSELSELCTDIGILDQGRLVLEGNIQDILARVNASNPLVISVYSNREQALSVLKSHPCVQTISLRENEICVRFMGDKQDEAMLLQQLVDAEVLVNGFVRETGSLESVFMQLTEREEERSVLSYEAESGL